MPALLRVRLPAVDRRAELFFARAVVPVVFLAELLRTADFRPVDLRDAGLRAVDFVAVAVDGFLPDALRTVDLRVVDFFPPDLPAVRFDAMERLLEVFPAAEPGPSSGAIAIWKESPVTLAIC